MYKSAGGPILATPKVVFVMFAGDPIAAEITKLANGIATADNYWSHTTSQYGIGPLTSSVVVTLRETPKALENSPDIESWLRNKLAPLSSDAGAGAPVLPTADGNTVYVIFYPPGTSVQYGPRLSCSVMSGYHEFMPGPANAYYAVVPRCPDARGGSALEQATRTASRLLVGAVTNPRPTTEPAFDHADNRAWEDADSDVHGGELGKVCKRTAPYKPRALGVSVQRIWSNQAAAAGKDPCQPDPTPPYFAAAPRLEDTLTIKGVPNNGLRIAVGETRRVKVDLFSEGPLTAGPWRVAATDYVFDSGSPAELKFEFLGDTRGENGTTLEVDITALKEPTLGYYQFSFVSQLLGRNNAQRAFAASK